jgi:transcriptional regulator with XRE-family HTH domain
MHKKEGTKVCTLYERINALCKAKGVSGSRMCLDLGLSKSTMSDLKSGRIKGISVPTAQKIAGYFGITVDELHGKEDKKEKPTIPEDDGLSESQKALMQFAMSVPDDKAEKVLRLMQAILEAD